MITATADEVLIAEIRKNGREVWRVSLRTFQQRRQVSIRTVKTTDDGEQIPNPWRSIAIKPGDLDAVITALQQARKLAWQEGLIE